MEKEGSDPRGTNVCSECESNEVSICISCSQIQGPTKQHIASEAAFSAHVAETSQCIADSAFFSSTVLEASSN